MNLESGPAVALAEGCVFSLLLIFAPSDLGWREEVREKQSGHYSAYLRRQLASRCDVTASQPDVTINRANQPGFLRVDKKPATDFHGFARIGLALAIPNYLVCFAETCRISPLPSQVPPARSNSALPPPVRCPLAIRRGCTPPCGFSI